MKSLTHYVLRIMLLISFPYFRFAHLHICPMTRILYLSHCGSSIGGGERQLYYLVTNLDRDRYQPIVVCPDDGVFADQLRDAGIPTFILPLPAWRKAKSLFSRYVAAFRLARFAKQQGIQLIHTSDSWFNPYLLRVSRKLGIPSVSHVRTPIRPDQVKNYRFKEVSMIISISERFKPPFLQAGISPEKILFIHDAVDLSLFSDEPPAVNVLQRDFPTDGDVRVGIVGRIEPVKKQLEFLQAAEIVLKSRRNVSFFLVGGVQSKGYFEQVKSFIADRGLDQHVICTGERSDMPEVLASLDILVTLSGGSIVFEAMACGKPVILVRKMPPSNVSWEIVRDGETGFVIPHEEAQPLAGAMMRLIDDPALQRHMGHEGRKWAEERFSHIQMARQTQESYDRLVQFSTGNEEGG